jgi:hypothetical protein
MMGVVCSLKEFILMINYTIRLKYKYKWAKERGEVMMEIVCSLKKNHPHDIQFDSNTNTSCQIQI